MWRSRRMTFSKRYKRLTFWNKVGFWSGICSIVGLLVAFYSLYSGGETTRQLAGLERRVSFEGTLLPGQQPDPPSACGTFPPNSIRVYLGDVVFAVVGDAPTIALTVSGKEFISLQHSPAGITVYARVWSADGRLIAEIRGNDFSVNPNNAFRLERLGDNQLNVYDQQGELALKVDVVNENAIRIGGIFQPGGGPRVLITDEDLLIDGYAQLSNVCLMAPANPNITFLSVG